MLSILIPVYNCEITPLVKELHQQLTHHDINYEIICLDDNSNKKFSDANQQVNNLPNVDYKISLLNNGRVKTRQILCEYSNYEHLLFLDADTMPVNSNFIEKYVNYIESDFKAIFGGIRYEKKPPGKEYTLRWKYGTSRESVSADKRNMSPYRSITSPNFLIYKQLFKSINSNIEGKDYGNDIYFSSLCRKKRIKILHIDNEVFHLGLEKNKNYISKSKEALNRYLQLLNRNDITKEDSNLIALYVRLRSFKLTILFGYLFKFFNRNIEKNLLSDNPSIMLFQLYRLSYICYLNTFKK